MINSIFKKLYHINIFICELIVCKYSNHESHSSLDVYSIEEFHCKKFYELVDTSISLKIRDFYD